MPHLNGPAVKPVMTVETDGRSERPAYLSFYQASPEQRIEMIRHGIPAILAKMIIADLAILGQGAALGALNLSPATLNRKAARGETLSPHDSERVVGMAKLVGQLEAMMQDYGGDDDFDATGWMARWLNEPLPALGGACPMAFMDTMEGQALVSAMLARVGSGAYA